MDCVTCASVTSLVRHGNRTAFFKQSACYGDERRRPTARSFILLLKNRGISRPRRCLCPEGRIQTRNV